MATAETDAPPRDPEAYRPGIHFGARFHDRYEDDRPPRHLDGEIVSGCIQDGTLVDRDDDPNVVWFEQEFGGVRYRLVANVSKRRVLTAYPVALNWTTAKDSGRWTPTQLEDIEEFIATDPRQ